MPTGGSGTGIAQDATLYAMISKLGAVPSGGSGTGIAQDATLQALLAALGPGPSTTNGVIFRPGVASSGNAVATWAEVKAVINSTNGATTVYVDSSHAAAHVPAATGVTSCQGAVTLTSFSDQTAAGPGFNFDVLTIDDGATLDGLRQIHGALTLFCDSKTTASLTFNEGANYAFFRLDFCSLMTTLTAAIPACEVTGSLEVDASNFTILGQAGAQPVFHIGGAGTLFLVLQTGAGDNAGLSSSLISGTGTLNVFYEATANQKVFPSFSGTQVNTGIAGNAVIQRITHALTGYVAQPYDVVVVDTSGGSVSIQLPTLVLGQWVQVIHDENTSLAANTVSIHGPGPDVTLLAQPPPNNTGAAGFISPFVFGGATAVFGGESARGMSLTYFNGGSAGGYLLR